VAQLSDITRDLGQSRYFFSISAEELWIIGDVTPCMKKFTRVVEGSQFESQFVPVVRKTTELLRVPRLWSEWCAIESLCVCI
jgi:hypothetical protein